MIRKVASLLCSFMILSVPWISAGASQPAHPTSQETVNNDLQANMILPKSGNSFTAAIDEFESEPEIEMGNGSETGAESQPEIGTETAESKIGEGSLSLQREETARNEASTKESDDSITLIETESAIDADGNVTMTVNTAEDLILPVTMTMKGSEGIISMTVSRSRQEIKIKPDTYNITKAVDGNGKKLPSGAELSIPKEGGIIYLDFNKPDDSENTVTEFLKTNCWFVMIAALLIYFYKKYFYQ